ncbi:MBL fold metallo-hydrolase [Methanococcoides orientis]|uniref:MBL fold metallo-hydrolase n=1 Tax=Methanococcoides orientis TaxID=2822137 RepID=UPI001E28B08B|nr:MBL fold metallo-hydrolase [Methanococcoides orientis]UGV41623.1 MBL fold metallo-hydrolase [Methanococcoides orientis]
MKITFLGTGVAIPQKDRVQSGLLMEISEKKVLFDCGGGVLNRIFESGNLHTDIDTIVLSHLHLDHVADVMCLLKANWLCDKFDSTIYGPAGTREWLNRVMDIYPYMKEKVSVDVVEVAPGEEFKLFDGCDVKCASGIHSVPSLAYQVRHDGQTVVYSGDTEPCEDIMELAQGCDMLIHECSFPLNFEMTNHTTPDMLRPYLKDTGIRGVYLTHLYPHMQGHEEEALEYLKKEFEGEVHIPFDLMVVEI